MVKDTDIEALVARLRKALLYMEDGCLTDIGDEAATTLTVLQAELDSAQTDLAKVILSLPTGKGERAAGAVEGVKMLRSRLEAERDAAVARAESAETEAEFFKGEVKLRNRIPSTNDTNADLLRRAEKAEAELTAAKARADKARDAALVEAAGIAQDRCGLAGNAKPTMVYDRGYVDGCRSAAGSIIALRDKPAETAPQPALCSTSEPKLARAVTVRDAARVLADYIDSDMMEVNRMIDAMKRVSMETPARHWLSQVVRTIAGCNDE